MAAKSVYASDQTVRSCCDVLWMRLLKTFQTSQDDMQLQEVQEVLKCTQKYTEKHKIIEEEAGSRAEAKKHRMEAKAATQKAKARKCMSFALRDH
jgi:DNA-binding transcriptional MerR regulator